LSDPPKPMTPQEKAYAETYELQEATVQNMDRRAQAYGRLAEYALDPSDKKQYKNKADLWTGRANTERERLVRISDSADDKPDNTIYFKKNDNFPREANEMKMAVGESTVREDDKLMRGLSVDKLGDKPLIKGLGNLENQDKNDIIKQKENIRKALEKARQLESPKEISDEIVNGIIENHYGLGEFSPEEMKALLEELGYEVLPLSKSHVISNVPFEEGGDYKITFGGDGYFQYHPRKKGSAHSRAYWRVKNGRKKGRFETDGSEYDLSTDKVRK